MTVKMSTLGAKTGNSNSSNRITKIRHLSISLNEIHVLNRQTNGYPPIEKIFSKVKEAEQINLLNNEKIQVEPDQLIVAPVRFSRLRRYFRHQKRMMRAQYRMMRLQRRLYRRHYRRPYGYGYFP
ncbi:unnamed protein product [Schistosoma spindalis]|nr:unnamed protein product [Schistosoma spindale]